MKDNRVLEGGMISFALLWLAVTIRAAAFDEIQMADRAMPLFRPAVTIDLSPSKFSISSESELYCDFQGSFFICERAGNRVVKLSAEGKMLAMVGGFGSGTGQFNRPAALCSPDAGLNLYLLDAGNRRIVRLSNSLHWIEELPLIPTNEAGRIGELAGLAVTRSGELIVSEPGSLRLLHFGRDGKYLGEYGSGKKVSLTALHIDEHDFLYALESSGRRLYCYDDFGNQIREILLPDDFAAGTVKVDSLRIYLLGNSGQIRVFDRKMQELWKANEKHTPEIGQVRKYALALGIMGRIWLFDPAQNRIIGYHPVR